MFPAVRPHSLILLFFFIRKELSSLNVREREERRNAFVNKDSVPQGGDYAESCLSSFHLNWARQSVCVLQVHNITKGENTYAQQLLPEPFVVYFSLSLLARLPARRPACAVCVCVCHRRYIRPCLTEFFLSFTSPPSFRVGAA